MSTITFDTLKFAQRLKDAGISEQQAVAQADALSSVLSESLNIQIATKTNINLLEKYVDKRFTELDKQLAIIKWGLALIIAVEVLPFLKTYLS